MSYLESAPLDETSYAPFAEMMKAFGFIPNFFRAQTMRPDLIEAELPLINAVLMDEGALGRRRKEYVFLVCSAANLSTYCVTAHCEMVRMLRLEGPDPEQIAVDHHSADLPDADKALLDFAAKLNSKPTRIGPPDIEALRAHGFSDPQILETVLMVGLAKFSNFVAFGLGTAPDFKTPAILLEKTQAGA
jgi:uncharacterized peroxidase-related enzyme